MLFVALKDLLAQRRGFILSAGLSACSCCAVSGLSENLKIVVPVHNSVVFGEVALSL